MITIKIINEIHLYDTSKESFAHMLGTVISFCLGIVVPLFLSPDYITVGCAYLVYSVSIFVEFLFRMDKRTIPGKVFLMAFIAGSAAMFIMALLLVILKDKVASLRRICLAISIILLVFQFIDSTIHYMVADNLIIHTDEVSPETQAYLQRATHGKMGSIGGKR